MKRFDGPIRLPAGKTSSGTTMIFDAVAFGSGSEPLVVIPGLNDGLRTVRGTAKVLSWYYRRLADGYRVWVISRPAELPDPYTTRAMAADYAALFREIGFAEGSVRVWGISQGGMIAQWLAIDHGELLRRICLCVSLAQATDTLRDAVGSWIALAEAGRWRDLIRATLRRHYTPARFRRFALVMPLITLFSRPKDASRFLIQARTCLSHDAAAHLGEISAPTLVIGGGADRVVGPGTSEELARLIPGAQLKVYPEFGHGVYEESRDAMEVLLGFLGEGGEGGKKGVESDRSSG